MYRMKKTKIVATMSDFRCTEEFVKQLFDAGMDVVRVNSAHVSEDGATHIVETVHRVNPAIPIMIDTKGPEIRLTGMAAGFESGIPIEKGQLVRMKGTAEDRPSSDQTIYLNDPTIYDAVPTGSIILIDDGELELQVVDKADDELVCEVHNGGVIKPRKSVNIPGVPIDLPSVTDKDHEFINWAIDMDIDFIAHLERKAGGNGNARLGVQELRDLLVGTTGAGKHARGRVGDTQGLHGTLHGSILAAGAVHGDKCHVKAAGRHGYHKIIGSRVEQLHRSVAGLLQCHHDVLSRIERDLTLGGTTARQDRYVHVL